MNSGIRQAYPGGSAPGPQGVAGAAPPLLEVRDLKKHFPVRRGIGSHLIGHVKAVDGVSFIIEQGQTYGLVGESGCGKTTTSKVILGVESPTSGQVLFKGEDIHLRSKSKMKRSSYSPQAVFQDPSSSLDPRMRVGASIAEPLVTQQHRKSQQEIKERVAELLTIVGLRPEQATLYPHEFSGGMRQRIAIARALAPDPELIVLDEPVSALDVSIRAQIMNLLKELQQRFGYAYLLIAHNLATVRHMSHRVGVMYVGKLVEEGDCEEVFEHTRHPYTKALIQASLPVDPDAIRLVVPLRGEVPSPLRPPPGCSMSPRCPKAMPACSEEEPHVLEVGANHRVACHLYTTCIPDK